MIEHAIRSLLTDNDDLIEIVKDRIYYSSAPQSVKIPYLILTKVSAVRGHVHGKPAGLCTARIQISIIPETYLQAKEIAALIQGTLQSYRGQSESMDIDGIFYSNEVDIFDNNGTYMLAVDYEVLHKE
jgi:hypothetical protein